MDKKGTIVFLHSSSELYGASKILIFVLEIVRKMGFSTVVVLPGDGPLREEMESLGMDVRIMNLGILRRKYFSPLGIINRGKRLLKAYQFLKELHQQEEIVLIYSNTLAVIIGAIFARKNKIKHVWHIHEILPGPEFLIKFLARQLDQSTPHPLVVSKAVAQHWMPHLKVAQPKVIHNGMDYQEFINADRQLRAQFGVQDHQRIITMVGRINPGKGQLFFLQMAQSLVKTYPHTIFWMVGDPYPGYEPIQEELHAFIAHHGLSNHVVDLGFRRDIPAILKASDIFVLPSILPDSFPTVILEAMAAGLPVIASDSGGAREMVVHNQTGYIFPIGDEKKGVLYLSKLLDNPDQAVQIGLAGQKRVLDSFSYQQFSTSIEAFLWEQIN
ncbi:MAG: glycosyltransferase family 4 protein [Mongoliitalea sp.]